MDFWHQGLEVIPGISDKGKALFSKLGIETLNHLIWHLPISYQDRRVKKIAHFKQNLASLKTSLTTSPQPALIQARVIQRQFIQSRKKYWRFTIEDDSGAIDLLMFNLPFYLSNKIQINTKLECFGSGFFAGQSVAMIHPKFKILSANQRFDNQVIKHYQAIYSTVQSLSQLKVQRAVLYALNALKKQPSKNYLDNRLDNRLDHRLNHLSGGNQNDLGNPINLPSLSDALIFLHQVPIEIELEQLHRNIHIKRLVVDELAHLILSSEISKLNRFKIKTQSFAINDDLIKQDKQLSKSLDFQLNQDQKNCIKEVREDLAKEQPMQRLIQGDVGSGKTIVSAFCALGVINQGFQVALLAPTEVLANQHYQNFKQWFNPLGIEVLYLSRSIAQSERKAIEQVIKSNQPFILIGTHLIFQKTINFGNLALVMIDEPQRFGVMQRLQLLQKGKHTHQLLISATPIPRTLAQSLYADLDISQIKEKPPNRQAIETVVFNREKINQLIERIDNILKQGQQVYWVCPRIETDDQNSLISAEDLWSELKKKLNHPIALVHGKMKSEEKNQIIEDFHQQKIRLLVATTVIEVGIDNPNASVMVIENANYLGLSTLHQLRGRVGRGKNKGYCVLCYERYLSSHQIKRLEKLKNTQDGFEIAAFDLETRGAGDLFGLRQKGSKIWQFFKMPEDKQLLHHTQQICKNWLIEDFQEAKNYLIAKGGQDRLILHQVK